MTETERRLHQPIGARRQEQPDDQERMCDLCGLSIDGAPITKTYDGEEKAFCCQGCANVYDLAYQNDMVDQVVQQSQGRKPAAGFRDFFVDSGETAYFSLDGMWCAGCAVAAERVLKNQPGVQDVDVSFAAERGRIQYDPATVDPAEALQQLDALGYRGRVLTDLSEERTSRQQERTLLQLIVAAAFGMQVMLLYLVQLYPRYGAGDFGAPDVRKLEYLVWLLATPILIFGGSSFLRGAWRALRARTATMDTLVALGTLSAYGYSVYVTLSGRGEVYFDSVAMITTFVMVGRYLEAVGGAQARKDIRNLLQLQPQTAWRQKHEAWQEVKATTLAPNDLILVKPGERVPADARILEGEGTLNEALLTGESTPVTKGPGDALYAGTVVNDAAFTARVEKAVGQTRLAQITHLVEETLSTKPPIQRMADKASAFFAFGILGAAALTVAARVTMGQTVAQAMLAGVAVLVVACPCALGLATPLALTVTLGRASRNGILVRKPSALEAAAGISRVVFDKTGTLTEGHLRVTEAHPTPESDLSAADLLCLAAAVEQYSEHPVARAMMAACAAGYAGSKGFQAVPGQGVRAQVSGYPAPIKVGSGPFVGLDEGTALSDAAAERSERGETVVWVALGETTIGFIALGDEPDSTASDTLSRLKTLGITPAMLSGDAARTTEAIATQLGLTEAEGALSPKEKAQRIRQWQDAGTKVAMVGDGVNDAPALAQADLSITVVSGTDVAGETSDIVLMQDDLGLIPWMISLSRRTHRIIRENLGWAFAYNLISVPLAAFGVISPVIAAGAMATSSLLVVGNSLRLRR